MSKNASAEMNRMVFAKFGNSYANFSSFEYMHS